MTPLELLATSTRTRVIAARSWKCPHNGQLRRDLPPLNSRELSGFDSGKSQPPVSCCAVSAIHELELVVGGVEELLNSWNAAKTLANIVDLVPVVRTARLWKKEDSLGVEGRGRVIVQHAFAVPPNRVKLRLNHDAWPLPDSPPVAGRPAPLQHDPIDQRKAIADNCS